MAKKNPLPGAPALPAKGKPGTYSWCEEVVEIMTSAWRGKEDAEAHFLAAARAADQYRIWEVLSPPPPEEPLTSLEALIRRIAEPGEAENMQIAIRFSGILNDSKGETEREFARAGETLPASAPTPPWEAGTSVRLPDRPLSEEEQVAFGEALLQQFAGMSAEAQEEIVRGAFLPAPGTETSGEAEGTVSPRRTAAQRKRDRLEQTHPDLADAVQSGELTLKQAYVKAGMEREVRTLDKLQRLWKSASEEERERFVSWLQEQMQLARREAYERDVYGEDE